MKLIRNLHVSTEYIHILNKMFLQAHFPHDLNVPATFTILFVSSVIQAIVHVSFSSRRLNVLDYIQIAYPLAAHFVAARILVRNKTLTRRAHRAFIEELNTC